jgi:hypothetical protein
MIIPIKEPGKFTLIKLNKYDMTTPINEKRIIINNCLNIFITKSFYFNLKIKQSKLIIFFKY